MKIGGMRKLQDARKGYEDKEVKLKSGMSNERTRQNGGNKKSVERRGQAVHQISNNESHLATWSLFCMKCLWGRFMI